MIDQETKLSAEQLRHQFDPTQFDFFSTEDLPVFEDDDLHGFYPDSEGKVPNLRPRTRYDKNDRGKGQRPERAGRAEKPRSGTIWPM